jgi:hypothetical protein
MKKKKKTTAVIEQKDEASTSPLPRYDSERVGQIEEMRVQ